MSTWNKSKEDNLTARRLKEVVIYKNGELLWLIRRPPHGFIGHSAGTTSMNSGYHWVSIDGIKYPRCRLVWLYHKGRWAPHELDHKNRIKNDDRIENLRPATKSKNMHNRRSNRNSKSGLKGVFPCRTPGMWYSKINVNKKIIIIGRGSDPLVVHEMYKTAAIKYFGEFARW